jgi:lipid II:glycine glycyltransferase (peptidoglycan interpeptide bridge formation enzyme)
MIRCSSAIDFFKLQERFERIPFTQAESWYAYLKQQGKEIVFYADDLTDPVILVWGVVEKVPLSKKKLLRIEGECCKDYTDEKLLAFFRELRNEDFAGIEFNSNTPYNVEFEVHLRRAGFVRPVGSFSCPLTIEVELQQEENYNRNWKRNVRSAETSGLRVEELETLSDGIVSKIISLFAEMAELKNLGYRLSHSAIDVLTKANGIRTFAVYDASDRLMAVRIIHVHNSYASDVIAANANEGRNSGATFLLMQRIFETLRKEGFTVFDFGRIPPSNHASDNVYLFKNASRGKKVQYNGEWTSYKSRFVELAVFVYKWLKIKKQRY